ncbi:hypothetical protein HK097_003761 [Rhizophlyctis rosea]|uniref:Uncharacterized protein n=1 Tax=Rhizophlyctis rosea TaxID=64517 RepID=A0AAD5SFU9_9FUNG|nr:hypothetical protein HK097_003761 [Rhizophlyctis rosea]
MRSKDIAQEVLESTFSFMTAHRITTRLQLDPLTKLDSERPDSTELQIIVKKPTTPPVLSITAILDHVDLTIHSYRMTTHDSAKLVLSTTAESNRQMRQVLQGPELSNERYEEILKAWLSERGLDEDWCDWVIRLRAWKEDVEYRKWLKGVAEFIKT